MTYGRNPLHTLATQAAEEQRRLAEADLAKRSKRRALFDDGSEIDGSSGRVGWGTRILRAMRRVLGR